MVEQVEQRLGQSPDEWLVDGGFPAYAQIDAVADKTDVFAPVPEHQARQDAEEDEHQDEQKGPGGTGQTPAQGA
jgi:hypothetical protein